MGEDFVKRGQSETIVNNVSLKRNETNDAAFKIILYQILAIYLKCLNYTKLSGFRVGLEPWKWARFVLVVSKFHFISFTFRVTWLNIHRIIIVFLIIALYLEMVQKEYIKKMCNVYNIQHTPKITQQRSILKTFLFFAWVSVRLLI